MLFSVLLNLTIYYMLFFTDLHRKCKQIVKVEKDYLQIQTTKLVGVTKATYQSYMLKKEALKM